MAGDQVWGWASPSEGELRPSEAHDFLSPSRPGPLLAIPKWLPLWKAVGALSHPGEELEGGHRPPEMLCRDGGHERQILGHLSLTAPVRIESFVFSRTTWQTALFILFSGPLRTSLWIVQEMPGWKGLPGFPVTTGWFLTYTPITPRPLSTTDSVSSQLWGAGVHSLSSLPC